uniref:Parathyroid hormone-like hormone a n=1 Tax=Oryzias latipes TaxID=8090 RepID=A0A3P9H410_ORYLA
MFLSRRVLQRCCLAVFLLCSPVPHDGRPVDAVSGRTRRSVTHTQLMHDKSRTLQDFRRRLWLQELLDVVHTAEIRDLPVRTVTGGGGGLPGAGLGINPSTTGSTLLSKPPSGGGVKNLPIAFQLEEEEGTNLPQETNKSQTYKDGVMKVPGKKRKKGRSGRRREGEKRKRRARSLGRRWEEESGSGLQLEWRSLLGLQRALL